MTLETNQLVSAFLQHLASLGFVEVRRLGPDPKFFGNELVEVRSPDIALRAGKDRDEWFVAMADPRHAEHGWYDVSVIVEHLSGQPSETRPLGELFRQLIDRWAEASRLFESSHALAMHRQLQSIERARAASRFPNWLGDAGL